MRSPFGMYQESAFKSVVLPLPVPPSMSTFMRPRTSAERIWETLSSIVPSLIRAEGSTMSSLNLRMLMVQCSTTGGTVTLTRERSAGRPGRLSTQSHMGCRMSALLLSALAILWAIVATCSSSRKCTGAASILPALSTQTLCGALTITSVTFGSRSSGSSGPSR